MNISRIVTQTIFVFLALFQAAQAQTMKAINLEPGEKQINQAIEISIDFLSEKKPSCGLRVDWGNGKSQMVKVGSEPPEGALTSPIKLSTIYTSAGKFNITLKGEVIFKGGPVGPCDVKATAVEVAVIDPVVDTQFTQRSWDTILGSAETKPMALKCLTIGVTELGIKKESLILGNKLSSEETPIAKKLLESCSAFQNAKKPEPNVKCKISSGGRSLDSICNGYYADIQTDGKFKQISIEEAIQLQVKDKKWVIGTEETDAGKALRAASEAALAAKEKQQQLEDERKTFDTRKIQTRTYQTNYQTALRSVLAVFQDNLYTNIKFTPELGLFQAEMPVLTVMDSEGKAITRTLVTGAAGNALGGLFGGGAVAGLAGDAVAGKSENGAVTSLVQATVEDHGGGKALIRIVFKQTIQITEQGGAGGGKQRTEESNMTEKPEVYQLIFNKVDSEVRNRGLAR